MNLAPIVLFVYNRPNHTRRALEALQGNVGATESDLFIFSDGPKTGSEEKVREVRRYIKAITGFRSVTVVERERNEGISANVIDGVTQIVNRFERVIVLEDDLVTSPYFLKFMNEALQIYEKEDRVISISGYSYPVDTKLPPVFFLKGADCWGWATWKRGWDLFCPDGKALLDQIEKRNLQAEFDFDGAYPYTQMLRDQIDGRNDSWAIRWYASAFLNDALTLYPGVSLVRNIGLDGSGEHCGATTCFDVALAEQSVSPLVTEIAQDISARKEISRFFKKMSKQRTSLRSAFARWLKGLKGGIRRR